MTPLLVATAVCLALGLLLVLRAVGMVATSSAGRFPFDALLSSLVGFALILAGVVLVP